MLEKTQGAPAPTVKVKAARIGVTSTQHQSKKTPRKISGTKHLPSFTSPCSNPKSPQKISSGKEFPWHIQRQRGIKKNLKQTTLTSYPAFDPPGKPGNPLVIDSDEDTPNGVRVTSGKDKILGPGVGELTRPSPCGSDEYQPKALGNQEDPNISSNSSDTVFDQPATSPNSKLQPSGLESLAVSSRPILKMQTWVLSLVAPQEDSIRPSSTGSHGHLPKVLGNLEATILGTNTSSKPPDTVMLATNV
ncbi:hypothetical protein PGT21_000958, partial [Puccinia graminis f. sp. tritici]